MIKDLKTQPYLPIFTMEAIANRIEAIASQSADTEHSEDVEVFGPLVVFDPCARETRFDFDELSNTAKGLGIKPQELLWDLVALVENMLPVHDTVDFYRECLLWVTKDDPQQTGLSIFRAYRALLKEARNQPLDPVPEDMTDIVHALGRL